MCRLAHPPPSEVLITCKILTFCNPERSEGYLLVAWRSHSYQPQRRSENRKSEIGNRKSPSRDTPESSFPPRPTPYSSATHNTPSSHTIPYISAHPKCVFQFENRGRHLGQTIAYSGRSRHSHRTRRQARMPLSHFLVPS